MIIQSVSWHNSVLVSVSEAAGSHLDRQKVQALLTGAAIDVFDDPSSIPSTLVLPALFLTGPELGACIDDELYASTSSILTSPFDFPTNDGSTPADAPFAGDLLPIKLLLIVARTSPWRVADAMRWRGRRRRGGEGGKGGR